MNYKASELSTSLLQSELRTLQRARSGCMMHEDRAAVNATIKEYQEELNKRLKNEEGQQCAT